MTLREAAQAVVDKAEPDDNFDGEFIDYLVPFEAIDALRAALAQPNPGPVVVKFSRDATPEEVETAREQLVGLALDEDRLARALARMADEEFERRFALDPTDDYERAVPANFRHRAAAIAKAYREDSDDRA